MICAICGLPLAICWPAGVTATALLVRGAVAIVRIGRGWRRSVLDADATVGTQPGLHVVDDDLPEAFVVPGLRLGRVVVTSQMLTTLSPPERRAQRPRRVRWRRWRAWRWPAVRVVWFS